jgi:hypothetical protein
MPIHQKESHLLWGKAAGRCSMPKCRKPLVAISEGQKAPSDLIIGEMAHIVGKKNSTANARGISKLPLKERDKYPNLILLCPTHHTLIDKDELGWPIERLHTIKREHELWVEKLLGKEIDEDLQIYNDFIDRVALAFRLENWEWLCDCLFRQIMPLEFREAVYQIGFEHFRAIMPGRDTAFESSLENLVSRSREYLDHYMSEAEILPGDPRVMAKRRYRDVSEDDYEAKDKALSDHNKWERNNTMLLFNFVHALNEFCDVVRSSLRPDFFVRKGRFCVHDFMGLMGATFEETWHIPPRYFRKEELDAPSQPSDS